jgi:hypothetical protein
MSIVDSFIAVEEERGARPRREPIGWIWPAGTRGVLAAGVVSGALGLAMLCRTLPQPDRPIVFAPELRLDVNTVPPRVLETLPHVGQTLVRQLVAARDMSPIASLDDAESRVRGLGPATLAQIAPFLRFDSADPVQRENPDVGNEFRPASKSRVARAKKPRSRKQKSARIQPRLVSRSEQPGHVD